MLHLTVNKDFTYLNYLSVMSAIRVYGVVIWVEVKEPKGKYWELIKKVKSIQFNFKHHSNNLIHTNVPDLIGGTDIIYLGEPTENYVAEMDIDHKGLYEEDGEFETKDMCLVKIYRPELVTPEYIRDGNTLLSHLVKRVLLKRVWNQ